MLSPLGAVGARFSSTGVCEVLAQSHARVRELLVLARRLAHAPADAPPAELRACAARVRGYFERGLPHHLGDEELALEPQLLRELPELAQILQRMEREHREHRPLVDRLVAICARVEESPAAPAWRAELARIVDAVAPLLAEHLDFEERALFPAIARLSPDALERLAAAVRARRDRGRAAGA